MERRPGEQVSAEPGPSLGRGSPAARGGGEGGPRALAPSARTPRPGPLCAPAPWQPSERSGQSWRNLAAAAEQALGSAKQRGSGPGLRGRPRRPAPRATAPRATALAGLAAPAPSPLIAPRPTPLRAAASRGRRWRGRPAFPEPPQPGCLAPVGASGHHPFPSARTPDAWRLPARHPGPSSHALGGAAFREREPNARRVGAGAFAQNLVEFSTPPPTLDTFPSSSFGGGGAEPSCPSVPLDRGPLPFCKSCRPPACCSGWGPCRCFPSKTDRQPLASKPDSSRQELCDLGAGKPLRASVPKSVKWGTRLRLCSGRNIPREEVSTGRAPGGVSSRLGSLQPGLQPQQGLRCEPLWRRLLGAPSLLGWEEGVLKS